MKKILSVILTLTMILSLTACGSSPASPTPTAGPNVTTAPTDTANPTSLVPTPTESADAVPEKYEHFSVNGVYTNDSGYMRSDLTSLELVTLMGNGTNLGNTMEAYGRSSLGIKADVSQYETFWGQPETTQEIISALKAAGFDSLRIPVAWTNMMDFENGDYTINTAYLDRVEEIINYAINEDMYVVVNDHWDGGWWGRFGSATESVRESAMEHFTSMWTQIAERYKEYSDYLIFECGNEELGYRLNDTDFAPDSGTLSADECYEVTNLLNQTFVNIVRSTGGNNEQRFLLVAGFGTDISSTCDDRFQMPEDEAAHLLLSVHFYEPSGYCINTSLANWGSSSDYEKQNSLLKKMTKFTEQGYGIVIGEYSVIPASDGGMKDDTIEYFTNFLNNCDLYGYCPMLWDCSSLFIRKNLAFIDDELTDLFADRSYTAQSPLTAEEIAANAKTAIEAATEAAVDPPACPDDKAIAWIMFNSSDWNTMYSVGEPYAPSSKTAGITATDVEITGAGTYTVALDFTGIAGGYANSTVFCALAIQNGELLYPGYCISIQEILINGEPVTMNGRAYTGSDDGIVTRTNLYNQWVTAIPDNVRIEGGVLMGLTPTVLDPATLGNIETFSITFRYVKGK